MEGLTRKDKMHKCLIGSHHIGEADECEIHRAITLALHQSDAGDYIDGIDASHQRDKDEKNEQHNLFDSSIVTTGRHPHLPTGQYQMIKQLPRHPLHCRNRTNHLKHSGLQNAMGN